jgi:hypothetical protein
MVPSGYQVIGPNENMPDLPDTEIALCMKARRPVQPVVRLYEHIVQALEST